MHDSKKMSSSKCQFFKQLLRVHKVLWRRGWESKRQWYVFISRGRSDMALWLPQFFIWSPSLQGVQFPIVWSQLVTNFRHRKKSRDQGRLCLSFPSDQKLWRRMLIMKRKSRVNNLYPESCNIQTEMCRTASCGSDWHTVTYKCCSPYDHTAVLAQEVSKQAPLKLVTASS